MRFLSRLVPALLFLGLLYLVLANRDALASDDVIFKDSFGDEAGGEDPPVCGPPPYEFQGSPFTLAAVFSPNPIGSALSQVKLSGGSWEAYAFTPEELPGPLVTWSADTSNVGSGAVGADARHFAVSECPGSFVAPVGCAGQINGEGPFLYTNTGAPLVGTCPLVPGKTYWFNTTVGDAPCNSALNRNLCAWRLQVNP